jgi:hypothetical protein
MCARIASLHVAWLHNKTMDMAAPRTLTPSATLVKTTPALPGVLADAVVCRHALHTSGLAHVAPSHDVASLHPEHWPVLEHAEHAARRMDARCSTKLAANNAIKMMQNTKRIKDKCNVLVASRTACGACTRAALPCVSLSALILFCFEGMPFMS